MGSVVRSLAFYGAFYAGTVLLVLAGLVAGLMGGQGLTHVTHTWTAWQSSAACARRPRNAAPTC